MIDTPAPGHVRLVREGESLQAAIEAAECGDTVELQAGSSFRGQFHFSDKSCDDGHWIIVRTSAPDSDLPAEGHRLTPCFSGVAFLPGRPDFHCAKTNNVLAKIEFGGNSGSGPLAFLPGANHYRFLGLEITRGSPGASITALGFAKGEGPVHHIVFDRVWIHGTAQDETTRGLALVNMTYVAVVDSFFSDFHCVAATGSCTDAQTLGSAGGHTPSGPYKIQNNFLEASGENILFGGGGATSTPADIEIRGNYLFKPLIWKPGEAGFVGGLSGRPFIVKNHFELKNAQRVLFEGNVLENVWGGFSQNGYSVLLTPKNQNNHCPACIVTDVVIRNCLIARVGGGFLIANALSDAGGASSGGQRYSIHDVVVEDVHQSDFNGTGLFALIGSVTPLLRDVRIDHVTAFVPRAPFAIASDHGKMENFSITNNLLTAGERQMGNPGGRLSCSFQPELQGPAGVWKSCFQNSVFARNIIVGGSDWPKDNLTPKDLKSAGIREIQEPGAVVPYRLCRGKDDGSPCKKASPALGGATDGKDIGADVHAIESFVDQAVAGTG
jgi:hypothetical protein